MTPNSVNLLHFIINNANGYIEENNGNKYLILVLTDERRWKRWLRWKIHERRIHLIWWLRRMYSIIMVVRSVFNVSNKYYSQVLLDECLYESAG